MDASTYSKRVVAQDELGEYNKAIAYYIMVIDCDLIHAIAYFIRGNARYNLGQYNEAIADFTKAIELDPTLAIAYNNRGVAHGKLGLHCMQQSHSRLYGSYRIETLVCLIL